ncbi:MAG: cytochrome P450 [Pseudomonadota bacterium]
MRTLSDYDACQNALRDSDMRQALYDAGAVIMDSVLLTLHGPAHTQRRRLEMRVFGRSFFKYYEQDVFPRTLEETLTPMLTTGRLDLMEFGYRVTINLTADFAGIDRSEKSIDETEDLLAMVKTFSEGATMIHSTRPAREVEEEVKAALARFDERFLQPSIARRKALLENGTEDLPRDVLTVLLKNEDKAPLSSDVLLREMGFYMQAGSHSTANAMVHSLHEIYSWAGEDDARWERVENDLIFVQRCVHESLRLHPASPEALRQHCPAHEPAGETIKLDLFTANRNQDVFGDDANAFNPERERPKGVPASGLSFGTGVHSCLGQELDGGVLIRPGTPEEDRQYGIVTLLVLKLLALGARPDPGDPAEPATNTSRPNWGRYPVCVTTP